MRDRGLDLIKFLAILTMVVDHCRFIFPSFQSYLMAVGRWAFPLFAFAIMSLTMENTHNFVIKTPLPHIHYFFEAWMCGKS